ERVAHPAELGFTCRADECPPLCGRDGRVRTVSVRCENLRTAVRRWIVVPALLSTTFNALFPKVHLPRGDPFPRGGDLPGPQQRLVRSDAGDARPGDERAGSRR